MLARCVSVLLLPAYQQTKERCKWYIQKQTHHSLSHFPSPSIIPPASSHSADALLLFAITSILQLLLP